MLLDTASLYFRAFFGLPDTIVSPDGQPVNAVRGLLDFINRLVEQYEPTHLVCCWDDDWRPQWRVDLVDTYKSHRVVEEVADAADTEEVPDPLAAQIPVIVSTLTALGIKIVGAPQMEADDVIGTLATQSRMPVDIVTGDRDLFQLIDESRHIRVLYTARGVSKHEVLTDESVVAKYRVLPSQYADFATLRGDSSDGLPGVAGVGEKTAAQLLLAYGDLDGIKKAALDPDSAMAPAARRKIGAAGDYLGRAAKAVAVVRDLDLGLSEQDLLIPEVPADPSGIAELSERWGLGTSVARLQQTLWG